MSKLGYTWYPRDFASDPDVMLMTAEERGIYRDLMDLAYMTNNNIKHGIDALVRYTNGTHESVNKILEIKGEKIDGGWKIPSCDKRIDLINKNKENGRKGGRPKNPEYNPNNNPDGNPKVNPEYNPKDEKSKPKRKGKEKEKEKENIMLNFELFWDLYSKKTGKEKCLTKFKSLKGEEIEKILEAVPRYVNKTPDVQFRKDPLTWLNGKHWEDEISENVKSVNGFVDPLSFMIPGN